ncbi:MAG TPA: AMP-dependent synthetase/ligase [Polyangiales bacterium]|nr:AMP-dependent synthetase/ligase [Polyangiales bacterium]
MDETIATRFVANVAAHADSIALRERRADGSYRSWTYREYAEQVARCAAGLRALGFGPGQRLLLMLRNRPEFHALDMAAYFCGGTAVSIYNSSPPEQIQYLVSHSEATIAIVDDHEFLARFAAVRASLPTLRELGVLGAETPSGVFHWNALVDCTPLDLARAAHASEPGGLATLIYTSGTTGPPKAVMLTHRNVVWTLDCVRNLLGEHPKLANSLAGVRLVSYLPMAHIAERNVSHYLPALYGNEVTCCPDATQLGQYLREVKPHIVFGVPRVWEKLHAGIVAAVGGELARVQNVPGLIGLDETLIAMTGAAPLPRELQLWFRSIGVPISDIYGMSECTGPMTWSPMAAKPGTVGRAIPGVEVKLGEDGEVLCRGPNVFVGYLKAERQTADALDADGWLHSGDIGRFDADGYLSIVDRKKELIITAGGDNISPANLEAALKTIPLVGQACVIGDRRPYVSALIVLDPDVAKAWAVSRGIQDTRLATLCVHRELVAEVEAGLERVMASFGRIERVKRLAILPNDWLPDSDELTPTAKLKRRAIHAKYKAEIEALYAATLAPPDVASEPVADSG